MIVDGKRLAVYREEGTTCVVEILADKSDDEWERFELECRRVLRTSRIVKDPEIGDRWTAERTKGAGAAYVGWSLDEDDARCVKEKPDPKPKSKIERGRWYRAKMGMEINDEGATECRVCLAGSKIYVTHTSGDRRHVPGDMNIIEEGQCAVRGQKVVTTGTWRSPHGTEYKRWFWDFEPEAG